MAVDVVVVNYRTDDLLQDFIASYQESKFEGCKLYVIDVGVGDDIENYPHWAHQLVSIPSSGAFSRFRENVGYAKACNAGAALGTNDVILLANADTLLSTGLQECHDALMRHAEWGVLGPRQTNDQGLIVAGGIFGTETSIGLRGWNELDRGQYNDIRDDAKSVSGSLYFIKRDLWEELTNCDFYQQAAPGATGAFLPTFHYWEETFCSYHSRAHGYKCVYYGPVQMTHHWHRASPVGGPVDQHAEESKAYYRSACQMHGIVHE
jgi:GT2 family glycosyltransferase